MRLIALALITVLLTITPDETQAIFGDRFKKLKNKAKSFFKSKFGKGQALHFLGHDVSEYPGANDKYRKMNEQKWQDYYDCLKFQEDNLGAQKTTVPEAIQSFAGGSVK